ncbi:hypothetical protein BDV93DRAFT_562251 [Ceratobasidium sp. AG-I]|nr:hypothetical protein BDV93DRAFT_562251 [Ceratobasidium sp. AG-I]
MFCFSDVIATCFFGLDLLRNLSNGTVVAVKTLRLHILLQDDDKALKRAVREVYLWSKLQHVNIQELLGVIVFQGGLGMVSPWMEQGNLQQYIAVHPDAKRYPLVTSGLSYLHSIAMIHGDLKAASLQALDALELELIGEKHTNNTNDNSLRTAQQVNATPTQQARDKPKPPRQSNQPKRPEENYQRALDRVDLQTPDQGRGDKNSTNQTTNTEKHSPVGRGPNPSHHTNSDSTRYKNHPHRTITSSPNSTPHSANTPNRISLPASRSHDLPTK